MNVNILSKSSESSGPLEGLPTASALVSDTLTPGVSCHFIVVGSVRFRTKVVHRLAPCRTVACGSITMSLDGKQVSILVHKRGSETLFIGQKVSAKSDGVQSVIGHARRDP